MNNVICYLNNNYIDFKINDKKIHIKSSNIKNGEIINYKQFIKEIKNKKIFSSIFTYNIIIYLNKLIEDKDIIYYTYIFNELNCSNIQILDTSLFLDESTLIVNDIYILYFNNNYYRFESIYLNNILNIFDINKLKIISDTKIKHNNKCKYFYYNTNNIIF